jgi:Fe-S cluster assembly protein SufD
MTTTAQPGVQAGEWYRTCFGDFERGLNGESGTPLHRMRREALERFASAGFPTTGDEEWRFTDVGPIARGRFHPVLKTEPHGVRRADVEAMSLPGVRSVRLVFVDGHFDASLSDIPELPKGVRAGSLAQALAEGVDMVGSHLGSLAEPASSAFTALSAAFLQDGAVLLVPDRADVSVPVHVLHVASGRTTPFLSSPRTLVVLGRGARASVVESYHHAARNVYLTNSVTEVVLGEDAVLEMDKVQNESESAYHVGSIHVRHQARSVLTANSISLGGAIVRNNVTAVLGAEGVECTLNGLSLATGRQLVDNHTTIDHAHPNCASHELYKCILDGRARGVFNGKIFVRKDAQKTDAKQTNKTLLLSDEATIDTKPQLEIFADDVKCTHGATVGQLDQNMVFYLRSRGIGLIEARDILTNAFAGDITGRVHVAALREQLDRLLHRRLMQGRLAGETELP